MTLGFHYHVPMIKKEDGIYTIGLQGVFLDSLSKYFVKVICFMNSATNNEIQKMDYKITSSNIEFIDIGQHIHMSKRILKSKSVKSIVMQNIEALDFMLIRGPSPFLPLFSKVSKSKKITYGFLLVADYLEVLKSSDMATWKKIPLYIFFKYNKFLQDLYSKDALVLANSRILVNEYKNKLEENVFEVRTTTLYDSDLYFKNNYNLQNKVNLLFTGRIESQKGIHIILEAMKNLKDKGFELTLNLVGWETEKGYLKKLQDLSMQYEMKDKLIYHGSKTVGIELLTYYRKSDIYILASTGNFEGFPRTIWEAMASSTPVIATKVSSIPYFLDDMSDSILVEPNDSNSLADGLEKIIKNNKLRNKIIKNAIEKVKDVTLEKQSKKLAKLILEYKR